MTDGFDWQALTVSEVDLPPVDRSESKRRQDRRRQEIGERDGWICGLCQDTVDPARRHPDPRAPSLDHIRTAAAGGSDTRDNLCITHWGCNHERNAYTPLTTIEEAEELRSTLRKYPTLRDVAESREPVDMVRMSQAFHAPERYRERLARRVERYEREGR
jgi:hypothetical protein